ncbi:MAG: MotA/TolQ/ExbB proton channel family protein [Myxococcota bacterium]
MIELFHKGGEMMYPILGASIFALAVIFERLIVLLGSTVADRAQVRTILEAASAGDHEKLNQLLNAGKSPVHRVMRAIATTSGSDEAKEKAAGIAGDVVLRGLNLRLPWLAILGSVVPLMGLLGTVVGMIRVFSRVASAGDVSDITLLAGGIWEALLTTAAGLSVAIPILLVYYMLQGRVEHIAFEMRRAGDELILALGQSGRET